ncbi:MAG: hypothetical protein A2V83_02150 [Nitrospirae bacterium RBG_16_64_22]|nr:MAG: hypothetical protein A2V83_02150 [Nitrospirae bacterium RBG_16_64_22]
MVNTILDGPGRRVLALAALAYLLFVIYGSLVPLRFHARPLSEAWSAFLGIRYLSLGIASRADWVANILLFVPLAFLWLGVLWPGGRTSRIAASVLVLFACVGLSAAIEFAQLFFPPRTVSLNDVLAEGIGAGIGVIAWHLAGPGLMRWVDEWRGERSEKSLALRLLYVYLFLLFGYNLLPLDLTISPVEIYHKWRAGRVVLVPFGYPFADPAQEIYSLLADAVIWIPAAYLWRRSAAKGPLSSWLHVTAAAVLLEFLQLFVYTRVSDVTDVLTASIGAAGGVLLAASASGRSTDPSAASGIPRRLAWWTAAVAVWLAVVAVIFWYPFDFRFEPGFVRERLLSLWRVPFTTYYFGTEYRAATEVFHKIIFFLPGGALLSSLSLRVERPARRRVVAAVGLAFIGLVALATEAGQVFLPSKVADLTDAGLEATGGILGYLAAGAIARRLRDERRGEDR